jgi:hypothetical protein
MSLKQIPATDLFQIALGISKAKEDILVSKYYNAILVAVHEGKFHTTFTMDSDHFGVVIPEEWSAMGKVEKLFPGIQISYDAKECSYTFSWLN